MSAASKGSNPKRTNLNNYKSDIKLLQMTNLKRKSLKGETLKKYTSIKETAKTINPSNTVNTVNTTDPDGQHG